MRRVVPVAALVTILAVGCTAPTTRDLVAIDQGKEQTALLLNSFAEAVRMKDSERLARLLPPGTPVGQLRTATVHFDQATWLLVYKGYTIDTDAALDRVRWQDWVEGRVSLAAPGSNFENFRLLDSFSLVRVEEKWYIRGFRLAQPMEKDLLDPPEEEIEKLRPLVQEVMDDLRNGRAGHIDSRLPREARFRERRLTFWQRLSVEGPVTPVPVIDDLRLVQQFYIRRWPDPDEAFQLAYLGSGRVVAFHEIPYDWPEGGITQTDTMTIEMTFRKDGDGWSLYMVRLFGLAFPFI
jgi:hypothetical protein